MSITLNNKQLRQHVMDEFDFEPSIDSADIGVAVESGDAFSDVPGRGSEFVVRLPLLPSYLE